MLMISTSYGLPLRDNVYGLNWLDLEGRSHSFDSAACQLKKVVHYGILDL
jgi:hypothetical protein